MTSWLSYVVVLDYSKRVHDELRDPVGDSGFPRWGKQPILDNFPSERASLNPFTWIRQ